MSACSELAGRFDFGPGLLEWLPGETLFSLISRQHRLSGRRLAAETCRIFFGSARGGSQHDFPTCLDELAHRTGGLLGSAEEIATRGTLLRFYAPFKSQAIVESCVAAMRGPSLGSLKFKLGLLTSRFRAHHPLKYCRSCVEVDAATEGSAYWHVEHQYLGVWVCSQHHRPLEEAAVKANGVGRHLWFLPADVAIQRESVRANLPVQWSAAPTVSGLAKMICETVERSDAGLLGKQARSKWSRLVARHRHEGVKAIRAMAPAVYAWLYRNDQGWLSGCNQQVERGARTTAPRVEWDERDSVLATKVKAAGPY